MIADREVGDGGTEGSDVADCFVAADKSRGGFLVTTEVMLFGSQNEAEI